MPIKIQPGGTQDVSPTPKRNKLSLMRLFIQQTLFCSIVQAGNYHTNQPFTQDQKHLIVFKELGLMFNPSKPQWCLDGKPYQHSRVSYWLPKFRPPIQFLAPEWGPDVVQNFTISWTLEFRSSTFYHRSNSQNYKDKLPTRKWNS